MECDNFCEYSTYSISESGIAGRAGITGTVVIDLDGLRTLIPEIEWFLDHLN